MTRPLVATILACAVGSMGFRASVNPIDSLNPGEWHQVPNSHLRAVLPNPLPPGWNGPVSIMDNWSGAAYDSKRDRLLVWGGGHADYGGNEVYAFDVNALAWSRIWGPSPNIPDVGNIPDGTQTYADGNPVAKHTYGGLEYLPGPDLFWSQGGSNYSSGNGTLATWVFDLNTSTWQRKANAPSTGYGNVCAYDSVTKHVFLYGQTDLVEYNPVGNSWATRYSGTWRTDYLSGAIDPVRRKFVIVGAGAAAAWDITSSGAMTLKSLPTTGTKDMENGTSAGFVYDPVADKFVGWRGGAAVYTLDPATWAWTKLNPAATNRIVPAAPSVRGTYGRFRYIPSKNAFIVVNSIDQDVYIYKLTAGGGGAGTPPTLATPPSATPGTVTGTTAALSVLGADGAGEASLTYTWSATGPAAVTFSPNATNGAKNATATFSAAGTYALTVTITNTSGASTASTFSVTVAPTFSAVGVSPASVSVAATGTQAFIATAEDQFGDALAAQPAWTWTVSGGGTISTSGVFAAGSAPGGPFTVGAGIGAMSGTASVTVEGTIAAPASGASGRGDHGHCGMGLVGTAGLLRFPSLLALGFFWIGFRRRTRCVFSR